jgi:hypothetical protein
MKIKISSFHPAFSYLVNPSKESAKVVFKYLIYIQCSREKIKFSLTVIILYSNFTQIAWNKRHMEERKTNRCFTFLPCALFGSYVGFQ